MLIRTNLFDVLVAVTACYFTTVVDSRARADHVQELQQTAITEGRSPLAHWGPDPSKYVSWSSHSLRLIPVYTFGSLGAGAGVDLADYCGSASPYRREQDVERLFGRIPVATVNPGADYFDQTQLATIQRSAFRAGKKNVILFIFDGMDWQTTRAAAIYQSQQIAYSEGRGTGLHFLDYTADGTSQFGWVANAPENEGSKVEVNLQRVINPGGTQPGGYHFQVAGGFPWSVSTDPFYLTGKTSAGKPGEHAYPDSAATATAFCAGARTYNEAINVDSRGHHLVPVAREIQQLGYSVGVVTSVPISHATPGCAYANNASRDDFQDISRDLLGLPSISHPRSPLSGVDVLIGGGFGDLLKPDDLVKQVTNQGLNFEPGNIWLSDLDLYSAAVENGGRYIVTTRQPGVAGRTALQAGAQRAVAENRRLLGFFGNGRYSGHLPYRTADGNYDPVDGKDKKRELYKPEDIAENPTLADMTGAALEVLSRNPRGFWLMVEAGDVDWANHDNNIDNSIGAVVSGDMAVKAVTDWVETHSNWRETLLIITSDHGHLLVLDRPELLIAH